MTAVQPEIPAEAFFNGFTPRYSLTPRSAGFSREQDAHLARTGGRANVIISFPLIVDFFSTRT